MANSPPPPRTVGVGTSVCPPSCARLRTLGTSPSSSSSLPLALDNFLSADLCVDGAGRPGEAGQGPRGQAEPRAPSCQWGWGPFQGPDLHPRAHQTRRLRPGALARQGQGPTRAARTRCPAPRARGSPVLERLLPAPSRPLIKLHILWRKDGVPLTGGLSDYNRRLTIPSPAGGDSGYYECEAVLRSSSVPAVVRGAYLSVLGEAGRGGAAAGLPRGAPLQGDPNRGCGEGSTALTAAPGPSSRRAASVRQGARETHHGRDGESGGHPLSSQR